METIDILLSTYNGEKFLKEQIDSILHQTHTDFRLVIRDDGSKDNTVSILKEYAAQYPSKIVLLPFDQNRGAMKSFEALLAYSRAPYCMFSDQDDFWLPTKVEHAYQAIKGQEKQWGAQTPILAYSDLQVVDGNLQLINSSFFRYSKIAPQLLTTAETLGVNNCVAGCTAIMNAAGRQCALPFGEHALMHDAWCALAVLAKGGKMVQMPSADILYRQHGHNVLGATQIKYGWNYFSQKIEHLGKVIALQKSLYLQMRDLCPISKSRFLKNRIQYLLHR